MKTLIAAIALCLPAALAAQTAPPPETASACTAPDGWADVLAHNPRFVVFGELHGTVEAPALVARIICAEAMQGRRVLLAIEHSSLYDTGLQAAWQLPHDAFPAMLSDLGWRGEEDGRASEAMLMLVTSAHSTKDKGAAIDIVAFNGTLDDAQRADIANLPSQGPHEAAQAQNIAEAAAAKDYDRVIVLVGGSHAATAPISIGGPDFDPMAVRLRSYGTVLSLAMQHSGGTSWNCELRPGTRPAPGKAVTRDMIACGAFRAGAEGSSDRPPHITVGNFTDPRLGRRYDGTFWLGPITASPPAFSADQ